MYFSQILCLIVPRFIFHSSLCFIHTPCIKKIHGEDINIDYINLESRMKKLYTLLGLIVLSFNGAVLAECSLSLPDAQFKDCIVSEGAGQSYSSYRKEMKSLDEEIISQRELERKRAENSQIVKKVK